MQLIIDLPLSQEDRDVLMGILNDSFSTTASKPAARPAAKKAAPAAKKAAEAPKAQPEDEEPSEAEENDGAGQAEFEAALADAIAKATVLMKTAPGKAKVKQALISVGSAKVSDINDTETALAFIEALA